MCVLTVYCYSLSQCNTASHFRPWRVRNEQQSPGVEGSVLHANTHTLYMHTSKQESNEPHDCTNRIMISDVQDTISIFCPFISLLPSTHFPPYNHSDIEIFAIFKLDHPFSIHSFLFPPFRKCDDKCQLRLAITIFKL